MLFYDFVNCCVIVVVYFVEFIDGVDVVVSEYKGVIFEDYFVGDGIMYYGGGKIDFIVFMIRGVDIMGSYFGDVFEKL